MGKLENIRKYMGFFNPYWGKMSLSILSTTLGTLFSLFSFTMAIPFLGILFGTQPMVTELMPFAFSKEVLFNNFNYYLTQIITNNGQSYALGMVSTLVVIFVLLKTSFTYLGNYLLAPIRNGVVRDVRNMMYEKILKQELGFFTEERKGDIISRMTSDVTEIETSVMRAIKDGIKAPITIVIYFVTLIFMNAHLTLFVVLMLPVTGFVIGRIGKSLRRKSTRSQNKLGYILSLIEESLFGLMIIKGFNAEEKFKNSFKKENEDYYRLMNKVWRRKDLASPVSEYLSTIVIVVVMFYGGNMVLNHTTTLAPQSFITYLVIFSQIISPAKQFSNSYYDIQRGLASYDRIKWLLSAPVTIKNISHPVSFNGFQKTIEYRDVGFSYGDKKVLDHFNLTIEKGKTIALVGQSGAGKTTVANLLPRFWDVNSGAILMDGLDIRHMDIRVLRDQLGIVSQESILFNDTIYNNISFGIENISEKQVIQAAKIANAHRFIVETEAGYQTLVGDRGSKLSGGQRQRISIARAVLKNPSILILDEATSALDTESEAYVQDAIEKLMSNRTAIIIAHRLSTIKNADEIVVMDEGKIVERGRHNELLQQNGVYANLHNMQVFK